jgi:hypothetical protein
VTEVNNGGGTYNVGDTSWLWGGAQTTGKTVVYMVTVPTTATDGMYPVTGTVLATIAGPTTIEHVVTGDNQVTVEPANIPPTVTVIYPNGGETLSGTMINASATDTDGTIASVAFSYSPDNGVSWTLLGAGTLVGGNYEYNWDTTAVPDGDNYLIRALATDDDGATGVDESDDVFSVGNNNPPVVEVISPNGGEVLYGNVTLNASAEDPDVLGYVVSLVFHYSDDTGTTWNEIGPGSSASDYYTRTWNTRDVENGTNYLIKAVATDDGGATGDDISDAVFTISNNPPVVEVIYPNGGEVLSGIVTLNASAEEPDPDEEIVSVVFHYSDDAGATWNEIGPGTSASDYYTCTWDTRTHEDGDQYMIKAVATDDGGATGEDTSDAVFTLDNGFCLALKAGWNFVSIPHTINGSNVATSVFSLESGESCLYYDRCAGLAGWWYADSNAINVVPCEGYWVYKIADETICVNFDPGIGIEVPSHPVCEGWNMIGHIHTSSMPVDGSGADFGSMTTLEGKFAQLWRWTPDSGWQCYQLGDFVHMTSGQAYWILMTEDATMSGMMPS